MRCLVAIGLLGMIACSSPVSQSGTGEERVMPLQYATGFRLFDGDGYYRVEVLHPEGRLLESYYLVDDAARYRSVDGRLEIHIPVREWASVSTTHVGFLAALGQQHVLKGITGSRWVHDPEVVEGLADGRVRDLGETGAVDHERLIALNPDILVAYSGGLDAEGQADQIRRTGIPVVMVDEYLEKHPLGMAEWGKLFALLLNDTVLGNAWYEEVKSKYETIAQKVEAAQRPKVMTGLPYRGEWTISGGQSFAATYMSDAGGNYLWADDTRVGNFPVSLEEVLLKASDADIWLNPGGASSLSDIIQTDPRLGQLPPVEQGRVYNINKRINVHGGNDYWESAVAAPHRVLLDLAVVFHPALFPADTLYYYTQLPE